MRVLLLRLRRDLLACVAVAGLLILGSGSARALTIDEITPLFFDEVDSGFSLASVAATGRTPDVRVTTSDLLLGAGAPSTGAPVQVTSQVVTTIHRLPPMATPEDPAIVDSTWTIENVAAGALRAPLLLFVVLDPLDTYPGDPLIGLDADLLKLVSYTSGGTDYVYGAAPLPDLDVGQTAEITVRYVVAGPLAVQNGSLRIAPLGLTVAATYAEVPEPSTLMLIGGALGGLAIFGRIRPARADSPMTRSAGCPDPPDPTA